MKKSSQIFIEADRGMMGLAIVKTLEKVRFKNLIYKTSTEIDLRNPDAVEDFFLLKT